MVKVCLNGVWIFKGREIIEDCPENLGRLKNLPLPPGDDKRAIGRKGTMAAAILMAHHNACSSADGADSALPEVLKLKFDALASHDITYVNIIQTASPSGMEQFPVPYVLTNCHNSLCAVGGTINADDHLFGLQAAKHFGGVFVPPHLAVIHSYMRECLASCGKMILGSDSHSRYGAFGTMGVGEGGGELVKQLLGQTCELPYPRIIAVYLSGTLRRGTGPQDIALAIISAVFKSGFVKDAVLEFLGDGVGELSADFRAGIDAMTTETSCWSSIWETDETIRQYLMVHGREYDYRKLFPESVAYYDGLVYVDLSAIKPMIALPFHPSNVYELDTLLANPMDILRQVEKDGGEIIGNPNVKLNFVDKVDSRGRIRVDQAIVAGCAGGVFDNLMAVSSILSSNGSRLEEGIDLYLYPGSQPILLELAKNGVLLSLLSSGAVVRTAFCGPCFGAGDVPFNNGLSIRHTTRNFPNREGSKPNQGQIASVCLMDARSIAATVLNGGYLASIESIDWEEHFVPFHFDPEPYRMHVYNGVGKPDKSCDLKYGPNITPWPPMASMGENLLLKIVSYITDPVTTTDELIPSGETSSFRSNPTGLAEFTLSRKDPSYVGKAKAVREASLAISGGELSKAAGFLPEIEVILEMIRNIPFTRLDEIQLGSSLFALKPGDGSAREQAASCQRVLGGCANIAVEYATKRYRTNLINWGILPFILEGEPPFKNGDYVFIPGIAGALRKGAEEVEAYSIRAEGGGVCVPFKLTLPGLKQGERELLLSGSLINYNRRRLEGEG